VLHLFAEHAADAIRLMKTAESRKERREAAHSLVGAARSIGAFELAARAVAVEDGAGDSQAGIAALERAIDAVRRAIAEHLSE
jgi:HPt (histidine-containing phosphotransfer) domain-containing protein